MNKKQVLITVGLAAFVVLAAFSASRLSSRGGEERPLGSAPAADRGGRMQTGSPASPAGGGVAADEEADETISASAVRIDEAASFTAAGLDVLPGSENAPVQTTVRREEIPAEAISIEVTAQGFSPNQFSLRAGQEATLALISADNKAHALVFPDARLMGLTVFVPAGESRTITFTAPVAGTYEFRDDIPPYRENTGKMIIN